MASSGRRKTPSEGGPERGAPKARRRAGLTLWLCLTGISAVGQGVEGARGTSITVAAASGDAPSVEGWKTGGVWTLRVRDASGAEAVLFASWRDPPVTTVSWVAAGEGLYTVECEPASETEADCDLAVISRGPGPAIRARRPGVEAALRNGYASLREWSPAGRSRAEREFGEALEESRALGLIDLEVDSLLGLAEARHLMGKGAESLKLLEAAADRARAVGDGRRFVLASTRLASSLALLGLEGRPETHLDEAMAVALGQGFRLGVARAHLGRGDVHYARSELAAAGREYASALEAFSRLGNVEGAIESHLGIGYASADLSQDAQAKIHFEQARDLARLGGDRQREATALRVLGNVFVKMTEEMEAIRCFEEAQALFEQADDRVELVRLYNGLGEVHGRLNDLAIAIQYHQQAEALARATGLRLAEGVALLEIAKYQQQLERLEDAASSYERARTQFEAVGDPAMAAVALAGLGTVAAAQGHHEVGIRHLQDALRTMRAVGEARLSSGMLNDLAEIYLRLGRVEPAREAATESSRLAVKAGDPLWESRSWYLLARAARMEGTLDEAQRLAERSLDVGEAVRDRVPGHELRALFFEELDSRYRFYVDLMMELERATPQAAFERLALAASERGRARALLDRFRHNPPPPGATDVGRLERERALRDEIRNRALEEDIGAREEGAKREALLAERLAELRRAQGVGSFSQPEAAPFDAARIEEIRTKLAGEGTLLVEFCLGPERSYLWAISRDRLEVHTLAPREALESQAREVYALLTGRQRDLAGSPGERRERALAQDARFYEKAAALSRELLGPIGDLDAFERLVVVSDGLLNYVPFSALPQPRATPGGDYRPLVLSHEVVRAPSLAVMLAIAERAAKREPRGGAAGGSSKLRVAILADPVFTADDPRVKARGPQTQGGRAASGTSLRGSGQSLASLPRLLASREEAASIARVARGADVTLTTDFHVDRARAEEALADAYQVVHLATHGILNDEHPLLSGIVTSLVDEEGQRQDGFLRAQDVYDSRVGAELVVLSACETALGRLLRGEGITGLVHAFLHAGADTIVASNWRVEDAATQQLMTEMYRSMFVDGVSVSAALRAAQIKLFHGRSTRAPFFWAAFDVYGLSPSLARGPGEGSRP